MKDCLLENSIDPIAAQFLSLLSGRCLALSHFIVVLWFSGQRSNRFTRVS
jgi:hypothetical protein